MPRKRLPSLPDTGRHYVELTQRARLASPGVVRYPRRASRAGRFIAALLLVAALVGAMLLLAERVKTAPAPEMREPGPSPGGAGPAEGSGG